MNPAQSTFPKAKLSDIVSISIGKTPSRNNPAFWKGNNSWAAISDLNGNKYINSTKEGITDQGVHESGIKAVPQNTLLFSFKLSIGKVAITGRPLFTNEAIAALHIIDSQVLDLNYLYYTMKELDFTSTGDKAVKGVTLNKRKLNNLKIPLPPLEEQKKIAAILDAADELRQKNQALIKKYDELTQSLFLDMFGKPFSNNKGFQTCILGEHSIKVQIGPFGSQLHKDDYINNGVPLINPMHINNRKVVPNYSYTISESKYNELSNYHLRAGDLILGRRGEMGRCALITSVENGWFCGTGSLFIRPGNSINPTFLLYLISSKDGVDYLEHEAKGVTMKNLNKGIIENIQFGLPSIDSQNLFAEMTNAIESQKAIAQASLHKSDKLFNSLLQKAFVGELTN